MIIDSHCHLDYEPMFSNLDDVIKRAKDSNVKFMLTISVTDKKYDIILNIIKKFTNVYGTYGIHPHEAKNHKQIAKDLILNKVSMSKKIIGIGETGLDFFYNHSEKKDQVDLFLEHIYAAQISNLPIVIHTRSAELDTLEILKKEKKKKDFKILIHCFTGSKKFAFDLLDIGAYISASGVVTFKKSSELAETFKLIPEKRILVETDAPYLAPTPLRGKPNEPSYILHTVRFLSNLKNIPFNEFAAVTTKNFHNLFGKLS